MSAERYSLGLVPWKWEGASVSFDDNLITLDEVRKEVEDYNRISASLKRRLVSALKASHEEISDLRWKLKEPQPRRPIDGRS